MLTQSDWLTQCNLVLDGYIAGSILYETAMAELERLGLIAEEADELMGCVGSLVK